MQDSKHSLSTAPAVQGLRISLVESLLCEARNGSAIWRELFAMTTRPWDRFRPVQKVAALVLCRGWPLSTALSACPVH
jgi:hypothetical protein